MIVWAMARKELELYFTSFLFYVVAAIFLALAGYNFYQNLHLYVMLGGMDLPRGLWQYEFLDMRQLLLSLVPLLTMRLFAEERKLGTLELLWTYPVRDWELILGKFIGCMTVLALMLAATVVYPAMIAPLQTVTVGPLLAAYLGIFLLAGACVAVGLFCSALTDSQLVAGASSYGLLFLFWILTWNEAAMNEGLLRYLRPFSLFDRFEMFARGVIDTRDITFFTLFIAAFLSVTFFALDARRWRGLR